MGMLFEMCFKRFAVLSLFFSLCPLLRTHALLEGGRLAHLLREAALHPAPDVLCDPEITEAPRRLLPMRVKGLQDSKGISNARAKTESKQSRFGTAGKNSERTAAGFAARAVRSGVRRSGRRP